MRKVLSFVLVLALVLGSFSMAFAATPTDVVGTDYSEAVTVLSGLGVVAGYPDGTYKPAQAVTRAEMAKLIVVALGLEDYAIGTSKFPDMAGATWAQGYVNYATGLGVILGYPDGTFKPSQTVSYDEAVAMIVRALGYTDASLLPATWPANYVVKAKALGVLADITAKAGGADRGDVAIMLYNALPLSFGAISNDTGKWVANSGTDNMLTRLGASEATVTVAPGDVGDEDVTLVDLSAYVYATVHAYKNSDGVIVSVASVHSDDLTGEFTTGAAIDSSFITLTDDTDVTLGANATAATPVYFNGGATTFGALGAITNKLLKGMDITVYGDLNVAETSFTTVAGIVAWAPTSIVKVATADVDNIADAIMDGNGDVLGIDLPTVDNKGKALDLAKITVVGAATKLADIAKNDVVYVYAAGNDTTLAKVKFEVVRNAKDIKVTKLTSTKVYAGTTAYELETTNTASVLALISAFSVTDDVTLYLGNEGKIAFTEVISTTPDNYGVVSTTGKSVDAFNATTYALKMLTADSDLVAFDVDTDTAYAALQTSVAGVVYTSKTAIAYTVNSDGQLTDVILKDGSLTGQTYNSRTNVLNGLFVADNVVVFNVSSNTATDWATTSISDGQAFTGSYFLNDDGDIAAIAYTLATGGTSSANYFAVNDIGTVQNTSEDNVYEVTGFKAGVANTSLSTHTAWETGTLIGTAPKVWAVTYSGIEITTIDVVPNYTTYGATVVDASGVYVKVTNTSIETIYEVAADVLVYVAVYDADGLLDSYKIGSMSDVSAGDKIELIVNSDVEVDLIVLTQRADVLDLHYTAPTLN
jgi:trimeric autotransporter adhesin